MRIPLPARRLSGWYAGIMKNSIPEDDWVAEEAEALLDSVPGLREDVRQGVAQHRAGTLDTVDAATARERIEARIKANESR